LGSRHGTFPSPGRGSTHARILQVPFPLRRNLRPSIDLLLCSQGLARTLHLFAQQRWSSVFHPPAALARSWGFRSPSSHQQSGCDSEHSDTRHRATFETAAALHQSSIPSPFVPSLSLLGFLSEAPNK